jgi:DNA-binding transcriptional LysR family regulator
MSGLSLAAAALFADKIEGARPDIRFQAGNASGIVPMEMYQIRYFLSVARTLNFTRAAEECGVAQPSLSRAIRQLEAELGGELFRRERPQAILTALGHRVLPILTRCFESAVMAQALAAGKKGGAGALRVALSPTIGVERVIAALREASRVFEGLELVVRRESAAGTLEVLKTGEVEVAIAAGSDGDAEPWLERFPLYDEGFMLVSSREHRLANGPNIALDDLRDEAIVLPRHAEHGEAVAASAHGKHHHDAWSDADLAALVAAGLGVAFAPRSFARPETLAATPVEGLDLKRTVSAFGAAGRPRSAPATMLINLLRAADWAAETA